MMHDPALIDLLWQRKPELLFVTREQFVASLDGWEIEPVENDGVVLFIGLTKGPEFHFMSTGAGAIPRRLVRAVMQKVIDRHGYVTVKTPKLDERQQRFNRAIGFVQVGDDEYDIHFRLDRFGRRTKTDQTGPKDQQTKEDCPFLSVDTSAKEGMTRCPSLQ